jgi:aminopeptidase C
MPVVYRILCIHLGTPPERFDWQWTDKDKKTSTGTASALPAELQAALDAEPIVLPAGDSMGARAR